MKIALDYDSTFTEDEFLWTAFVENAKQRGHSISFVTFRHATGQNWDIEQDAKNLGIDIVYCNYKQKSSVFSADVWIDDSPQYIPTTETMEKHFNYYGKSFANPTVDLEELKHKEMAKRLLDKMNATYLDAGIMYGLLSDKTSGFIVYIFADRLKHLDGKREIFENCNVEYRSSEIPKAQ